jgi:hypothetical protein
MPGVWKFSERKVADDDGSEVFQVRILNAAGDVLWDPTDRVTAVKAAEALYSVLKGHALDGVELKHWIAGE